MTHRKLLATLLAIGATASGGAQAAPLLSDDFESYDTSVYNVFENDPAFGPGGTKSGTLSGVPWLESSSNSGGFSTNEIVATEAGGNQFAQLGTLGGFSFDEISRTFSNTGTTGIYRVTFSAWGDGRVALYDTGRMALVESSDPSNTGLAFERASSPLSHSYVVNSTVSATPQWNTYSFDVNLNAGQQYKMYLVAGWDDVDNISGTLNPAQDSGLFGVDNLMVAEVPEPETYAMMLAGLGALGFMARRRRIGGV